MFPITWPIQLLCIPNHRRLRPSSVVERKEKKIKLPHGIRGEWLGKETTPGQITNSHKARVITQNNHISAWKSKVITPCCTVQCGNGSRGTRDTDKKLGKCCITMKNKGAAFSLKRYQDKTYGGISYDMFKRIVKSHLSICSLCWRKKKKKIWIISWPTMCYHHYLHGWLYRNEINTWGECTLFHWTEIRLKAKQ